jgi:hypothetical protein
MARASYDPKDISQNEYLMLIEKQRKFIIRKEAETG